MKKLSNLQLVDDFLQVVGLNLTGHDFHHLLADLADLLVLGVGGLSDLVGTLLCETHAEQTQKVAIGGLHIHMGFNHGLNGKKDISG